MLRLSIAMATYNGEKYLYEQLQSLAKQTVKPFELVVCDDGSRDDTLKIIRNYIPDMPFPVRVYENEQRLNFTGNFLKAASLCAGDAIAFCDQDDIWDPRKIEICSAELEKNGSDIIVHGGRIIDQTGKPTQYKCPDVQEKGMLLFGPNFDYAHGFAMILRSSLISEVLAHWNWTEYLNYTAKYGRNIIAHSRFINAWSYKRKKCSLVDCELVFYRRHEGNTSAHFADSLIGHRANSLVKPRPFEWIISMKKIYRWLISIDEKKAEWLRQAQFEKAQADFVHAYHVRFGYGKLPGLCLYEDAFMQGYNFLSKRAHQSKVSLFLTRLTERLRADVARLMHRASARPET
jgi:glycosyltransferase involved in cell wall biosynthesis